LQPLAPHAPQRHNGYIYAVAHAHDVDCRDLIQDGKTFVDIDAGFEVAPGDASDIEVANAHPWGSRGLVFSDGAGAGTALGIASYPCNRGMSCYFLSWIPATKSHMKTGKKWTVINGLLRDGARVAARYDYEDVLLRRCA
jgi:hypothetical protein